MPRTSHAPRSLRSAPRTTRFGVLALGLGAGCFYAEPINDVPAASITVLAPGPHHVGDSISFDALKSRDDHRPSLRASWQALACESVAPQQGCVTIERGDRDLGEPFVVVPEDPRPLVVQLTLHDRHGARDRDELVLELDNRDPDLTVQVSGYSGADGSYVVTRPARITAAAGDRDGEEVTLSWSLQAPRGSLPDARSFEPVSADTYELVPDAPGLWVVHVEARDPRGGVSAVDEPIVVAPDGPPCVGITEPPAPADGTYVLTREDGPRTFGVHRVDDDLDPFPAPADGDPITGEARFRWQSGPAAGDLTALPGHASAELVVDPAEHAPGDRLHLRVEIDDRVGRVLSCADADPTCAVESGSGCMQRVSWEVEIR